jgi:4-amino-4-deoxy-L-arabinose transferase-like glycosyltransferase
MEIASGSSWRPASAGGDRILGLHPLLLAVLVQLAVWSIGPGLLFGNLHSDTLEAAYWGRDWALGYAKHPPVTTWLIDLVIRLPIPRIFGLMLLSQVTMAVAAYFLWRLARLYASRQTAALVVLLFLTSPSATIYAVQLNHNSMLAPFWAASAYFGMQYLEERRWSDAIGLAVAAGIGALTKYEILFLLVSLLAVAILVRRFRPAFFHPASYVCMAVFLLILAPHIWWLDTNRWPSLSRALGTEKVSSVAALNISAINGVVGLFTLLAMPVLLLLATMTRRRPDELTRGPRT